MPKCPLTTCTPTRSEEQRHPGAEAEADEKNENMTVHAPKGLYPTGFHKGSNPDLLMTTTDREEEEDGQAGGPKRSRSLLQLMSSSLFGIYDPLEMSDPHIPEPHSRAELLGDEKEEAAAAAAEKKHLFLGPVRLLVLFVFGVGYGLLVTHLHDNNALVAVKFDLHKDEPIYLAIWGFIGILLGSLLPAVDYAFAHEQQRTRADWNEIVQCVGAFLGIAWGVRKLAWGSTMEASLTLTLLNPALWYLIDRSLTGFVLAALTGVTGTCCLMFLFPGILPYVLYATRG